MKGSKIRVLITEDDLFLINIYATKFEKSGYDVDIAENGEKGIEKAMLKRPDVILLDILMPKMNGFEFLKAIKKNEGLKDVPIILLTNLSQKDDVQKGMELGASDFLIKAHFMPSEVVAKVEDVIKKSKVKAKKV